MKACDIIKNRLNASVLFNIVKLRLRVIPMERYKDYECQSAVEKLMRCRKFGNVRVGAELINDES